MPFELFAGATLASTYMNAKAAKSQAESQEALYKYNAEVKDGEAKSIMDAGHAKATEIRKQNTKLVSQMQAGYAKSGVMSDQDSPLMAMTEQTEIGEMDALMTSYNARVGAIRSQNEAKGYRYAAKSAKRAGKIGVGQALFSGATQIAGGALL